MKLALLLSLRGEGWGGLWIPDRFLDLDALLETLLDGF